jgi:hypothetical protein
VVRSADSISVHIAVCSLVRSLYAYCCVHVGGSFGFALNNL